VLAVDHLDAHLELVEVCKHVVTHVVECGLSAEVFVFLAPGKHSLNVSHHVVFFKRLVELAALLFPTSRWSDFLVAESLCLRGHLPALILLDFLAEI